MKRKNFNAPIRAILGLVLGFILCLYPDNVGDYLVILLGLIFMIPSAVYILLYIAYLMKTEKTKSKMFPIVSIGCLMFGAWLIITPSHFVQMITAIIGILMIIGSVQQLYGLQRAKQWTKISGLHYFIPIILLVSGIIVMLNPIGVVSTVMTFAGIVILIYSFNELIRFFVLDVRKPVESNQGPTINVSSPDTQTASSDASHLKDEEVNEDIDDEKDIDLEKKKKNFGDTEFEDVDFDETKDDK